MNRETMKSGMVWAFIGIMIPIVYMAVKDGAFSAGEERPKLEPSMASVPTVSRETMGHELAALAKELEREPAHVPILLRMAQLARGLDRPTEAIGYLREALGEEPDHIDARLELGRVLYETGDLDGAIEQTTLLLEQEPENVDALYNLGAIYGNMMDEARARELWERAVEIDPESQSGRMAALGLEKISAPPSAEEPRH